MTDAMRPPRYSLIKDYREKISALEDELLEWKEAAEIANAENAELRNAGRTLVYEAPRTDQDIRVRGVGRDLFEPRAIMVHLTERPTDDEIRSLHEFLRGWKP